jgi:hypothetical protein
MDWYIHGVVQDEDATVHFPYLIDYHTHGLEKHGLKNLCMFFDYGDYGKTNMDLINTIAQMMVNGEKFSLYKLHYIDDENGNILYRFALREFNWRDEDHIKIIVLDENYKIPEIDPSYDENATDEEIDNIERIMRYQYQCMDHSVLSHLFEYGKM